MSGHRTSDGIRLTDILRLAGEIGAKIRAGGSHPYILSFEGLRACPLATSTHARDMVAPWLARATGKSKREAYEALRNGYWN